LLEGEILLKQGHAEETLSLLQATLPAGLAEGDLSIKQHMLRALALARLGRTQEAQQELQESERLATVNQSELDGELARAKGVLAIIDGDLEDAELFFRKSLQIARQRADRFLELTAFLNLGVVAMKKEHHDESIEWLNHTYDLARSLQVRLTEEKALGDLGLELYYMGDFERSRALSLQAADEAHELDAEYDEVQWLDQIGLLHYQANELSEAESYYKKSFELAKKIQNKEKTVSALTKLALLSVKQGHLDDAERLGQEAMQLARGDRPSELSLTFVLGLVKARRGDDGQAEKLLLSVADDPQSDSALRWESENSLALLDEGHHQADGAERHFRKALQLFEAARSSVQHDESRLPFLANASHLYDDYIHFLIQKGKPVEALQQADFSRAQTLAEGLGVLRKGTANAPGPLDPQRVAGHANATILFYWLGPEHSYLWVITDHQARMFPLPTAPELEALVERYSAALKGPQDAVQTANSAGVRLYSTLIAPAQQLAGKNQRFIIVPDGPLTRLNFETLIVTEPKLHYWIEDAVVSTASSLRLLAEAQRRSAAPAKLLLIGDAVPVSREYPPLGKAAAEIASIKEHFAPTDEQVFAGDRATPAAYQESRPAQFSYIHFVAHGISSRLSPLDSAIVLSRGNAEEDSFKLYARDIVRTRLQARLVTISSCYGAGSRAYSGEGLVGLSWAFLRAGAHNVIGALWEVSDSSTPQLMGTLYSELRQGRQPEVALRSAKLSLLHSGGVFSKPFYWAPFQLYTGA